MSSDREILDPLPAVVPQRVFAPSTAAITPAFAVSASMSQDMPFVGRKRELETLVDAFQSMCRQKTPVSVFIEGESGIGKTALVRQFAKTLPSIRNDVVCLFGRSYEREAVAYKGIDGVVDALGRYLRRLRDDEAAALLPSGIALLTDVFPALRRVNAVNAAAHTATAQATNPQRARSKFFSCVRELFLNLSERVPLVVLIDDIQWADWDSLHLLREMLRPPNPAALLLIATWRTGSTSNTKAQDWHEALRTGGEVRKMEMEALSAQDGTQMAQAFASQFGYKDPIDTRIVMTEGLGHPLFIQELVAHACMTAGRPINDQLRLDDVLRIRISALSSPARNILNLIAVAAFPVHPQVIAEAVGMTSTVLSNHLATLRSARLVRTVASHEQELITIYHDRIREAVSASLNPEQHKGAHRALAQALEGQKDTDPERLAMHWSSAGAHGKAADYLLKAATSAEATWAFDHAADLLKRAIECRGDGSRSEAELYTRLAEALGNAGRGREAAEAYLRAARDCDSREARLDLTRRAATEFLRSGYVENGLNAIGVVLNTVRISYPKTTWGALISLILRRILIQRLRFDAPRPTRPVSAKDLQRLDACWSVANGLSMVDNIRGADFTARAMLLAWRVNDPGRLLQAVAHEVVHTSSAGPRAAKRIIELLAVTASLAQKVDNPQARALALLAKGASHYLLGRFLDALQCLDDLEPLLRDRCTGANWELASARFFRTSTLFFLGRTQELHSYVLRHVAEAIDHGDLFCATNLRLAAGHLAWLVQDDVAQAEEVANKAMSDWTAKGYQQQHWYALEAQTRLDLYRGNAEQAYARMRDQWPALKRSMLLRIQFVRIVAVHQHGSCALALACEKPAQAELLLKQAERDALQLKRQNTDWATGLGNLIEGGIHACRKDKPAAIEACRNAAATFDRAHMSLFANVARVRLGDLMQDGPGHSLGQHALTWMKQQSIRSPERWVAMLAPGFHAYPAGRTTV